MVVIKIDVGYVISCNYPDILKEGRMRYIRENGRYVPTSPRYKAEYHPEFTGFFPRMWSSDQSHIREYERWGNIKGTHPTFVENIRFFLRYQVWHMYGRYFMWNFVGRQNDNQSFGDILNGNWLSGIRFIDEWRLGPQDNLPLHIAGHPARNTYYGLPLLLGLAGMFYLHGIFDLDRNGCIGTFWVVTESGFPENQQHVSYYYHIYFGTGAHGC